MVRDRSDVPLLSTPSALLDAVEAGDAERVERLLAAGVDANDREDPDEDLPLAVAVALRRIDIVRLLLEAGANPNFPSGPWESVLEFAAHRGDRSIL